MLAGSDGETGEDEAQRVKECARDDGPTVAEALRYRAKYRLADTPCKVLDGDGHRKIRADPAEFVRDGKLEHAKAGADAEVQDQDERGRNKNGREQGGFGHARVSYSWEADAGGSGGNGQIKSGDGGYAFWERVLAL